MTSTWRWLAVVLGLMSVGGACVGQDAEAGSSYVLDRDAPHVPQQCLRPAGPVPWAQAMACGDFTGDGRPDVIVPTPVFTPNAMPLQFYVGQPDGTYRLDQSCFADAIPGTVHAAKAIVGDYNEDGAPDVLVADHGYDQPPFPGGMPVLLLSGPPGKLHQAPLPADMNAPNHGGASADINGDGHLDLFLTRVGTFYMGDGQGQFTRDASRAPDDLAQATFTCEVRDVDEDGYVDLLLAGHEHQGRRCSILWGTAEGVFSHDNETLLPARDGYGVVLDIDAEDLDGDGRRDLILTRTGSDLFYQGYCLQLLHTNEDWSFADETDRRLASGTDPQGQWIARVRLVDRDGNGAPDIVVDDAKRDLAWMNDGNGYFWRRQ
ncbi:VCBS repeat-containing protein [bacterium]|nr:VCBS repeat-containing protein [bacterium]